MTEQTEAMDRFWRQMSAKMHYRNSKPGNTETPWVDFERGHLKARLIEEFTEWNEGQGTELQADELIDIANMCMILWLHDIKWIDEMAEKLVDRSPR